MSFVVAVALVLALGLIGVIVWQGYRIAAERAERKRQEEVSWELDRMLNDGWRIARDVDWLGRGEMEVALLSPLGMGLAILVRRRRIKSGDEPLVRKQAAYLQGLGATPLGCAAVIVVTHKKQATQSTSGGAWIVPLSDLRSLAHRLERECAIEGGGRQRLTPATGTAA